MKFQSLISIVLVGAFAFGVVAMAAYEDLKGEVEGKVKLYDGDGSTGEKLEDAEVRLYKENGRRVDDDDTNSKGKFNFEDVAEGEYYIKCSADGHVNAKDSNEVSYTSSKFDVEGDETTEKNCRLMKVEGDDTDYSERPKGTSKREWRAINGHGGANYSERPKGTSKREWRIMQGL